MEETFSAYDLARVEEKIIEIEGLRNEIITDEKIGDARLSEITTYIKANRLEISEYNKLWSEQTVLKKAKIESSRKTMSLKLELKKLQSKKELIKSMIPTTVNDGDLINSILHIKNKYIEFERDKTRIPAMRKMAQEFTFDLQQIIDFIKQK